MTFNTGVHCIYLSGMFYSLLTFPAISVCTRMWVSIIGHWVRHHRIQNTWVLKKWTNVQLDTTNSNSVISDSLFFLTLSHFPSVHPSVILLSAILNSQYFEFFFCIPQEFKISHHKTLIFFLGKQMNFSQKLPVTRLQYIQCMQLNLQVKYSRALWLYNSILDC